MSDKELSDESGSTRKWTVLLVKNWMERLRKKYEVKQIIKKNKVIFVMVCVCLFIFCQYENKHLVVSPYYVQSEKLSEAFDGYKIVQIADLHNARFGKDNQRLVNLIKKQEPDILVITGDLVDASHTDMATSLKVAEAATTICPVFFVTGNHEHWLSQEDLHGFLTELREKR